jgi:hypothetical protein
VVSAAERPSPPPAFGGTVYLPHVVDDEFLPAHRAGGPVPSLHRWTSFLVPGRAYRGLGAFQIFATLCGVKYFFGGVSFLIQKFRYTLIHMVKKFRYTLSHCFFAANDFKRLRFSKWSKNSATPSAMVFSLLMISSGYGFSLLFRLFTRVLLIKSTTYRYL